LKRHKTKQECLEKEGFFSIFDFMARMKERADRKAHMERLVASTLKNEQAKDAPEESAVTVEVVASDTDSELESEVSMTKRGGVGQVRRSIAGYSQCKETDDNQAASKR
jgi:hypothetical protein